MKTFRVLIAFLAAAFLMFCFVVIAIFAYLAGEGFLNIIGAGIVLIIGLIVSRFLFNMMRRRGILSVLAGSNASYYADELNPTKESGVRQLNPQELTQAFQDEKTIFIQGVTISIWGDWQGRKLDERHQIKAIEYDEVKKTLTLQFHNQCLLKVIQPRLIMLGKSYLKIVKAKEIVWQISTNTNTVKSYSYLNTGGKIKTESNTNWQPHSMDIGIGMQALYLQG